MSRNILVRLAKVLDSAGIPYMIIGGQAVLLYGEPRLTRDIDVTLGVDTSFLPQVLLVVSDCRFRVLVDDPKEFVNKTWVLPTVDDESGFRVDFIFSWTPYEREAMSRARYVEIEGYPVKFSSPEDVIIHKILAGRPRDLEDVLSILRKQKVDEKLIRKWLGILSQAANEDLEKKLDALLERLESG